MALARVPLLPVKKLTVMGTIGKTQGVSNATNPEPNAIRKKDQRLSGAAAVAVVAALTVVFSSETIAFWAESTTISASTFSATALSIGAAAETRESGCTMAAVAGAVAPFTGVVLPVALAGSAEAGPETLILSKVKSSLKGMHLPSVSVQVW